jgi:UDP-N-acetylmuramoylalanine--D-glutamate ligase
MLINGQSILVLGLGDTGLAAARWLSRQGARVTVADSRQSPALAESLRRECHDVPLFTGPFSAATFAGEYHFAVISPGVPLATPAIAAAIQAGLQVVGDVQLFADAIRNWPTRVIAITGSNGKSTVTALTGALCEAAGLRTVVAGNIGLPVLDALIQIEDELAAGLPHPDVVVLELSSFQLESTASLRASSATVLNISEDHLDRYTDLLSYAHSKTHVFNGVQQGMVLNRDDVFCRAMVRPGVPVIWFGQDEPASEQDYGLVLTDAGHMLVRGSQPLLAASELRLAGLHNAANALAALALTDWLDLPLAPRLAALKQFTGLAHRVAWVRDLDGVSFYDDSKGTNVGATEAALKGMTRPVILIAGGDGKGQDFTPLRAACADKAKAVMLIGRDAAQIQAVLDDLPLTVQRCDTLEAATTAAWQLASSGDVVLLSPACASLDMFRNYSHRAEVFVSSVQQLESRL